MAFDTDDRGNRTELPWRGGPHVRSYRVILRDTVLPLVLAAVLVVTIFVVMFALGWRPNPDAPSFHPITQLQPPL